MTAGRHRSVRTGWRAVCTILLLCVVAHPVGAQDRVFPYELKIDDLAMIPVGIGMTVLGNHLRDQLDPLTREEVEALRPSDINWFDRTATDNWSESWDDRSDLTRDALIFGGFTLAGVEGARTLFHEDFEAVATVAVMTAELTLFTMGATYITKALVGRKRPYVYNEGLSLDDRFGMASSSDNSAQMSFFSGHTSAAFALATFSSTLFQDIHGKSTWSKVWWGTSLSFAALTGVARVKAGVHFPTDVIAGALAGSAIGYLVPRLHRRNASSPVGVAVSPTGVGVRVRF